MRFSLWMSCYIFMCCSIVCSSIRRTGCSATHVAIPPIVNCCSIRRRVRLRSLMGIKPSDSVVFDTAQPTNTCPSLGLNTRDLNGVNLVHYQHTYQQQPEWWWYCYAVLALQSARCAYVCGSVCTTRLVARQLITTHGAHVSKPRGSTLGHDGVHIEHHAKHGLGNQTNRASCLRNISLEISASARPHAFADGASPTQGALRDLCLHAQGLLEPRDLRPLHLERHLQSARSETLNKRIT